MAREPRYTGASGSGGKRLESLARRNNELRKAFSNPILRGRVLRLLRVVDRRPIRDFGNGLVCRCANHGLASGRDKVASLREARNDPHRSCTSALLSTIAGRNLYYRRLGLRSSGHPRAAHRNAFGNKDPSTKIGPRL